MDGSLWEKVIGRRKLLKWSHLAVVAVGLAAGLGSVPLLRPHKARLRPPGALDEDRFVATCIKCGQCLQVCPPQVVRLADLNEGFATGTPYIVARAGGCILCPGLPCVLACPTAALDHNLMEGKDAHMGLAVLSKPETCLAMLGQDCRICLDKCPIKDQRPIVFERRVGQDRRVFHEPVVQSTCVGCGKCEQECPTKPASITITPRLHWRGAVA